MAGSGPMFSSSSVMTMTTDNNGQPQVIVRYFKIT